ncbi:MAG: cytochrome c-type biogenesis protein CcmH [Trueperaceae bacterium]|nr:cytochrome c-type biogenesis protein CcmH [Trueperaceae bacterium]
MSRLVRSLRLAAVAGILLGSAFAQDIVLDSRVFDIGNELRCPTCVAESVGESNAAIAREMRQIIQEQLDEGRTRAEILGYFQERYGDWILLSPPRRGVLLIVWLLPVAAVLVAGGGLFVLVRRWRAAADEVAPVAGEDLARVRAALAGDDPAGAISAEPAPPAPRP